MSTSYSPKIVTDGLVLALDAGNRKSYAGSGTIWNDLSGNNNTGTLSNSPTFTDANNGSFTFNGTNSVQTAVNIVCTAMTILMFIKRNGTQISNAGLTFNRGTSVTGLNFYGLNNTLSYHWNNDASTYNFASNLLIPDNVWSMVGMSVTSTAATLYVNMESATNINAHASTTIDNLRIAVDTDSGRRFTGNIATTLLYNKALSPSEVLQNFNATRNRFGV
jgi:hypothetical protein